MSDELVTGANNMDHGQRGGVASPVKQAMNHGVHSDPFSCPVFHHAMISSFTSFQKDRSIKVLRHELPAQWIAGKDRRRILLI